MSRSVAGYNSGMSRRKAFTIWAAVSLLAAGACTPPPPALPAKIDAALAAAGRFLAGKQSADGAWRSETYGVLRDGPSLTPYVLKSLFFVAPDGGGDAFRKGVRYVTARVADGAGAVDVGLPFPVYTAAAATWVVTLDGRAGEAERRAQSIWLAAVRGRQLTEALGWAPADPEYGGWGYAIDPPRKPAPGEPKGPFSESNLSATVYALGALRAAGVPREDPAYGRALAFVKRCQNFSDDPAAADPRFDDGGFFFTPGDPVKNKAGRAGEDRHARTRYHSYGSMTANGLRALLQCGLPADHPRVAAARRGLERNFSAKTHPGTFAPEREVFRESYYYYYTWSVAHAFLHLGARVIETKDGKVDWAAALAEELIRRQRPDGSWDNRYTDAKEDDPLVATPAAAAALAICRRALTKAK